MTFGDFVELMTHGLCNTLPTRSKWINGYDVYIALLSMIEQHSVTSIGIRVMGNRETHNHRIGEYPNHLY